MSGILEYTKKFIILKNNFCNIEGKKPKGHVKIEGRGLKGNLTISVENGEANQYYDVALVLGNRNYVPGKLYTDKFGKAREDISFNISELESKGLKLDRISGVLIFREANVLLGGYIGREDQSIERFIKELGRYMPSDEPEVSEEEYKDKLSGDGLVIEVEEIEEEEEVKEDTEKEPLNKEVFIKEEGIISEEEFIEKGIISEDETDIENEMKSLEQSHIEVEFIDEEEFKKDTPLEVNDEFFVNAEEVVDDSGTIENDVYLDEDDVLTYIRSSTDDVDRAIIDNEGIEYNESDYEEIAAINMDRVIGLDEKVEFIENDLPIQEVIINDVDIQEELESEIDLQDYDKEIIEQYEKVFRPESLNSNEEVIKISHIDYEQNRRIIQRDQTTEYILNILKYFPQEDPFRQNLKGYKWWRIDFQDEAKGFLPYFNYVLGGKQKIRSTCKYTTARELMNTYNHYLFGIYSQNNEVKYYIYGIPGGFYTDEHPHGGVTGFNTWYSGNEAIGYWLLYIDSLTGDVIYPLNPMTPMD